MTRVSLVLRIFPLLPSRLYLLKSHGQRRKVVSVCINIAGAQVFYPYILLLKPSLNADNRDDRGDGMFSIGQTLRIRVGPLKGYLCRVIAVRKKDVTVKLDSQQKVLTGLLVVIVSGSVECCLSVLVKLEARHLFLCYLFS